MRLTLLVEPALVDKVDAVLTASLPDRFAGHPVPFPVTWDTSIAHRVEVTTAQGFLLSRLGLDPADQLDWRDWLTLTGQAILEVTAGEIFRDDDGRLTSVRGNLAWYPDDVWRLVVAVAWRHLAEDLNELLSSRSWLTMRVAIAKAIETLNRLQNEVGLPTIDAPLQPFFDRPYDGIADSTMQVLLAAVGDEEIRSQPIRTTLGLIDQWCRDEALLSDPIRRAALARHVLPPK